MSWWKQITELWQGDKEGGVLVQKTVTLPAADGGSADLFTVAGGRVRLTDLVGSIVTTPTGTAGTVLIRLRHTPATGVTNMCADSPDIKGLLPTNLLTITGVVGGAMADGGITGIQSLQSFATNQQVLEPGIISLFLTETAVITGDVAGAIKWTIKYVPVDPGAVIVAA